MNLQKIYQDLAFVSSVIPNGQQLFYQGYVNGISGQTAIKVKSQGSDPITVIKIGGSGGYLSDINPSPSGLMDAKCIGAIDFGSNNILSTSLGTYHSNYYNHGCIIIGDSNSGCFLDYELYDWGNAAQKSIVIGDNNILAYVGEQGDTVPSHSINNTISIGSNNKLADAQTRSAIGGGDEYLQIAFNNSLIIGSNITINSNGTVWGIEDDENLPKFVLGNGHDFKVNHLIQSVQGKYFDDSALLSGVDYQLVVGNGTSGNLSNIYTRDFNGNIWTAGNISGNNLINTKKLQNGLDCQAIGVGSHAEGLGTISQYPYQHVGGKYNESEDKAYIIGGGDDDSDRKNIFSIDWNGNLYTSGIISAGGFSGLDISGSTVINNNMIVSGGLSSNTLYVTKNFIISNIPSSNNTKLSGYYYNRIDCFDKKNKLIETSGVTPVTIDLYLSSQQVTFEQGVANQDLPTSNFYTTQFPLNYQVGDFISLVNGSYYGYCAKISKIDGNKITLAQLNSQFTDDMKSNFNLKYKSDGITIKSNKWWRNAEINDKGDYSIYVIQKALSGIVDLANQNSIIVGNSSNSFGNYSYTRGTAGTTATGPYSTALGYQTYAVNYGTFAVGQYSRAQGIFSFAQGHQTSAILKYSHAEGNYTLANGVGSHAEGYKAIALGKYSHAEGIATSAICDYSHAEGLYTVANNDVQHVQGQYNTSVKNTIHIVGYGNTKGSEKKPVSIETIHSTLSSLLHREALITLMGDQTSGYATIKGNIYELYNDGNAAYAGIISANQFYDTKTSSFIKNYDDTYIKQQLNLKANLESPIFTGTIKVNNGILINGKFTCQATGNYSHAEGQDTKAYTKFSHAEGNGTIAGEDGSNKGGQHAEGNASNAIGAYSHTEGSGTKAFGYGSHAEGIATSAMTIYSHTEGDHTISNQDYQHVIGRYNDSNVSGIFVIGGGNSNGRKTIYAIDLKGNSIQSGIVSAPGFYDTTNNKLIGANDGLPVGSIITFVGHSEPGSGNYLLCNGASLPKADYPLLFDAISSYWGSVDNKHFSIPDMIDRFLEGSTPSAGYGTIEAGVPNITGSMYMYNNVVEQQQWHSLGFYNLQTNGAFTKGIQCTTPVSDQGRIVSQQYTTALNIDASNSNSIYGKSNTVQPPAVRVRFYIKYK